MKKVYVVDSQFPNVQSGPGRFLAQLRASGLGFKFFIFSNIEHRVDHELGELYPIPYSSFWPLRSYRLALRVRALPESAIIVFKSAFEAIFARRRDFVFVSDDNYLLGPSSLLCSEIDSRLSKRLVRAAYFFVERFVVLRASCVIANSNYIRDLIIAKYGVSPDRVRLLYKGIEFSSFGNFLSRPILVDEVVFAFAKNDWRRGGLGEAFEFIQGFSLRSGRSCRLIVAGISPQDRVDVHELYSLGCYSFRLEILGVLSTNDLISCVYGPANFFLNFAHREALGVAVIESVAAGCLPIVSGAGGIHEVVGVGYPLSKAVNSSEDIWEIMLNVSASVIIYQDLAGYIRENFNWHLVQKRFIRLLEGGRD